MAYEKVGWKDYPDKTTPINAENLNKMEEGIANNDKNIGDMSKVSDKADGTLAGIAAAQAEEIERLKKENDELNSNLANKAPISHTHDDRYYTETEINSKINTINSNIENINTQMYAIPIIKSVSRTFSTNKNGNSSVSIPGIPIHAICTSNVSYLIYPYTRKDSSTWWVHVRNDMSGTADSVSITATFYYI